MRFLWHFLESGSQVFLEIEYDDSLRQCLTSSKGKTHENFFLPLSQFLFISFPLNCIP